jgi:hypothetical protein
MWYAGPDNGPDTGRTDTGRTPRATDLDGSSPRVARRAAVQVCTYPAESLSLSSLSLSSRSVARRRLVPGTRLLRSPRAGGVGGDGAAGGAVGPGPGGGPGPAVLAVRVGRAGGRVGRAVAAAVSDGGAGRGGRRGVSCRPRARHEATHP